jgi:hypothetical protein
METHGGFADVWSARKRDITTPISM